VLPRFIFLALFIGACSGTSTGESTSTTVPPPTTTTTLGAADVYGLVSPSLAFVETPIASGSAVLVDSTTLITNAHVVWPAEEVSVSFPNGTRGIVPIVGYDWMADLALVDVTALGGLPTPTTFDTNTPAPGTTVYLVGYPADDLETAAPAITAGIVSRTRTWLDGGMTFIQSDALISGGQSGGALVDDRGRVIGISGLSVGEGFALALTAADVEIRIAAIRDGTDIDHLGGRAVLDLVGAAGGDGSVPFVLDEAVFVFEGVAGDLVSIEVTGSSALNADLVGPDGFVESTSGEPALRVVLDAELVLDGPYFVVVYPEFESLETVAVTGVETRTWTDPDHGRMLEIGSALSGNGDYPGDLDWFVIELEAGQTVTIVASSINIDASLLIDLLVPDGESVLVSDSDSGGGVIGFDSSVEFTAPEAGSYAVAVFDETGFGPGGYVVRVEAGRR
jgi:hypothetical protein